MKKLIALVLALMMVLSLAACGGEPSETTGSTEGSKTEAEALGEGANSFSFTVVDLDGTEKAYEIHTDETIVGEALEALELLKGTEGEYGLYVTEVCGITAEYEVDGTYWAFYIDGEYALTGVDVTEITAGAAYSFVRTEG